MSKHISAGAHIPMHQYNSLSICWNTICSLQCTPCNYLSLHLWLMSIVRYFKKALSIWQTKPLLKQPSLMTFQLFHPSIRSYLMNPVHPSPPPHHVSRYKRLLQYLIYNREPLPPNPNTQPRSHNPCDERSTHCSPLDFQAHAPIWGWFPGKHDRSDTWHWYREAIIVSTDG